MRFLPFLKTTLFTLPFACVAAFGCAQKLTPEEVADTPAALAAEAGQSLESQSQKKEKTAAETARVTFEVPVMEEPPENVPQAASAEDGKRLYEVNCVSCHGERGSPPWHTIFMSRNIPDFGRGAFQNARTDQDLYATITNGVPKTRMRGYLDLTDRERWSLVRYLRALTENQEN